MKNLRKTKYKRMNNIKLWVLAVFAGVFLFGGPVQAQPLDTEVLDKNVTKVVPLEAPIVDLKEPKVEKLEDTVEAKVAEVDTTAKQVENVKAEADKTLQVQVQLTTEVTTIKSEIELLKQKVVAKQKQEAAALKNPSAGLGGGSAGTNTVSAYNPNGCNTDTQWIRADNRQCKDKTPGKTAKTPSPVKIRAVSSAGNTYANGQCTWHVKNMKPELPNRLGNADRWYANAQAQGWPTGTVARAGAAAQSKTGMHVVYVLEVYANGTMLISEMNYDYVPHHQRTVVRNQSSFVYIY